jgi:hypothetical protein
MGNLIQFQTTGLNNDPKTKNPKPHFPAESVRNYLRESKKDALLRSRVPESVAGFIARVAEVSNTTPSGLTRMIVTDWALNQGVHCPPDGPQTEKAA